MFVCMFGTCMYVYVCMCTCILSYISSEYLLSRNVCMACPNLVASHFHVHIGVSAVVELQL